MMGVLSSLHQSTSSSWAVPRLLLWLVLQLLVQAAVLPGVATTTAVTTSSHSVLTRATGICDIRGCNCTRYRNDTVIPWQTVNCTLSSGQEMNLEEHHVSDRVMELYISGGGRITLGSKALGDMPNLALFEVDGARSLLMEKHSFFNLTCPSLLIRIRNCDRLDFKTGAFEDVQSSIKLEVRSCALVSLEKSPFANMEKAVFEDIRRMELAERAFEFKNQGKRGPSGPVTNITFDNVTIPKIPHQTFSSILSEVRISRSEVYEVQKDAFSSLQISSVTFVGSKFDTIHSGAFDQQTLIFSFEISKCTIAIIAPRAIAAAIGNLTVQHSRITEIASGAVNTATLAQFELVGNEIVDLKPGCFAIQNWNTIVLEQNIIKHLGADFLVAPPPTSTEIKEFTFRGNDVYGLAIGSLSFVPQLKDDRTFTFRNNFFNQTCHCPVEEWMQELMNSTAVTPEMIKKLTNSTFCNVTDLVSECFKLEVGMISIRNFTELVCHPRNNTIVCEPYKGETKIVNTTSKMFLENNRPHATHWMVIIITCTVVLIVVFLVTTVIMLIRGSRWLKRNGYFRKIQYNSQNEQSNDDENTIETVDENDKLDISEDLTLELLEYLRKRLDDPDTKMEASEQIEQLYQKYIHGNENNNQQQEEEAHLYEELGNLQPITPPNRTSDDGSDARSILKIMEEKFNIQFEDIDSDAPPPLVGDYSEPSDAAIHLYSELKKESASNSDSLASRGSSMAARPLPDKPGSSKMM